MGRSGVGNGDVEMEMENGDVEMEKWDCADWRTSIWTGANATDRIVRCEGEGEGGSVR